MPQDNLATKKVLDRNISALNAHDIEAYLANQHPDVELILGDGTCLRGHEQVRQYIQALLAAFPDGQLTFGQQVLGPDAAATEVSFSGTNTGPLPSPAGMLPPTGRTVHLRSASMLQIRDGLIASEHNYADQLELMTQLGLAGPAGPPAT